MIATTMIERALAYAGGSHTLADIEQAVAEGTMQLWEGEDSALVTEIRETPQQKLLMFFLAGGNLGEIEAMLPPILEWGRSVGCTVAKFVGREGWERTFLQRQGWKSGGIVMEKSLG